MCISRGTTPDFPREIRYVKIKITSCRLNVIYLVVMDVYFIIIFLFLQNLVVDSIVYLCVTTILSTSRLNCMGIVRLQYGFMPLGNY